MRAGVDPKSGPFLLPARVILVAAGVVAVGLGLFNLLHELHAAEVDRLYAGIALVVAAIALVALGIAFLGWRLGIFLAGIIAFVEFGELLSTHFVSGPAALSTFVKHEGLALATVDMALIPLCMLVVMSAGVCWTNPRGRNRNLELWPVAAASLLGALLVILQATDDLHRGDFGAANPEDGAFAAAVLASLWLAGGLWVSRLRRVGALLVAIATFGVVYSFVTLHLLAGGKTVAQIAAASGAIWAGIAAAAVILAAASFVVALWILASSFFPRARKDARLEKSRRAVRRA